MEKTRRKRIFLALKLLLAAGLLVFVFAGVPWRDYVQDQGGKAWTYLGPAESIDANQQIEVVSGHLWWRQGPMSRPVSDFEPVRGDDGTERIIRDGLISVISTAHVPLLVLGAVGSLLSILIIAFRFWYLLGVLDIRIKLWEAVRLTFLGQFFSNVIPGNVGGDLVKIYYVARHTPRKAAVLLTVFLDRVMGLAELAMLAAVMVFVSLVAGLASYEELRFPLLLVTVVVVGVVGTFVLMLSRRLRKAVKFYKLYRRLPFAEHIAAAGEAAREFRDKPVALVASLGMTVLAHGSFIGGIVVLGWSLGMPVGANWYRFFAYLPLIYIIGAVPVTPGGVGIIEGAYKAFFASIASVPQVLALALLARLLPIFWSLPGAWVAVTGPRLPKSEEIEAELSAAEAQKVPESPEPESGTA